ncbi:MAG: iron ABC transporter substrate-binding protein [Desulfotignum sp.]|nr:iron ABC transporter substrate-binding protein [Desulfotignum sp.]
MKKISCMILIVLFACGLWQERAMAQTVTVTDMAGRQVTAPFDPERIICIGPGALRLIVYLQARDKVAGVEEMEKRNPGGRPYWIANPQLWTLPRCGPGGPAGINKKPDMEAVLSVRPDVIFLTYMEAGLADQVQQTLNIPVVVLSYGTFATFDEAVYDSLAIAGRVLNREERATAVLSYIESLKQDLHDRTADIPKGDRPRTYVGGIGFRGAHGIESTEQQYIPFTWVHAANAADQVTASVGSHVFMNRETLLKLNPDIIFIDGGGTALVAAGFPGEPDFYNALTAFRTGRVYTLLPFNWYTTNIDTALADAYAVGKILYPDRFADVNPEVVADDIYRFLVGQPVYDAMKKQYGTIGQKARFIDRTQGKDNIQ